MKKINTLLLSAALVSALASCEMKEELTGGKGSSDEMGLLDLTVATSSSSNTVVTKAVTDVVDDFPVYIVAAPGDTTKRFASFAELKEQKPIELPFGTYTVVSNSPVPYERKMQYPYYKGEESVEISEVTETTTVKCTIQNVKIAFVPSAAFRNTYSDWTITVSDRLETSNNSDALIATFTPANSGTDSEQAYEYWKLGNDVDKIYINGTATLKDGGETVTVYGVAEKKNLQGHTDKDGNFFKGGDELVINLNPDKIEGSTAGVEKPGVVITIGGFNSETNETIEIDVTGDGGTEEPGGEEPGGEEPGGDEPADPNAAITISDNGTGYLTNGVTVADPDNPPTDLAITMTAKNKIQSVIVRIESSNDEFMQSIDSPGSTIKDLVGDTGMDLAAEGVPDELGNMFAMPQRGADDYTFKMESQLFTMLGIFPGKHEFHLTVIDQANPANSKSATLTINL